LKIKKKLFPTFFQLKQIITGTSMMAVRLFTWQTMLDTCCKSFHFM